MFWRLCDTPVHEVTLTQIGKLPATVVFTMMQVCASIDEHSCIVAAEPPDLDHFDNCPDNKQCSNDWHTAWWNRMGRYLLDRWYPILWKEAVRHFQYLEFGEMGMTCLESVLATVRQGGVFLLADQLVRDTGEKVANVIVPDCSSDN